MKNYILAIILLFCSTQLQARYAIIGINGGAGAFYNGNGNAANFPGFEAFGSGGIDLGFMANKHFGVMSGIYLSSYKFDITDGSYIIARQSITTTDIPLCFRYVVTSNKIVKFYMQPGLVFAFTSKAHFVPGNTNPYDNTRYFEADNTYNFRTVTVRPILDLGFMFRMAKGVYFNLGWELSAGGQNAVKPDDGDIYTEIQGHDTKMGFSYAQMKLGFQFHL